MSYILDALKKSEQQRQRSEVPSLYTAQVSGNVEKQPALLQMAIAAAVLICAGVLIGWFHPWQQDVVVTVSKLIPPRLNDASRQPVLPVPARPSLPQPVVAARTEQLPAIPKPEAPMPTVKTLAANPPRVVPQPAKAKTAPLRPAVAPSKSVPVVVAAREAAVPTTGKPATPTVEKEVARMPEPAGDNENVQEQKIYALSELPPAIQQEIPKMTISGYAYSSTPKERTVGINDRLLQEGEFLSQGLRLERISPDGLLFSYKKYQFRISLQ